MSNHVSSTYSAHLKALNLEVPSKAVMASLPEYSFAHWRVDVIQNAEEFDQAVAILAQLALIGYDSEADPCFTKGEKAKPTSVIQLASEGRCYVFLLEALRNNHVNLQPLMAILTDPKIIKVGAALRFERQQVQREFSAKPESLCDLVTVFQRLGIKNQLGIATMLAMLTGKKMAKSKTISRSCWSQLPLTQDQIDYASADAMAPFICHKHLREILQGHGKNLSEVLQARIFSLLFPGKTRKRFHHV